jgi:hypothetical protein
MPIFDLTTAVQQGLSRDPANNDWHVSANSLEVGLADAVGASEFRVTDSNNVSVIVANSDGYLAANGNVEVHGGNLLVEHRTGTNIELLTLKDSVDQAGVFLIDSDPNATLTAQRGSIGLNYTDGYMYINRNGTTSWERIPVVSEVGGGGTVTLQQAYDNDADGANATITTNATDGSVEIAGTESLLVNATGGINLDSGFDMDATSAFDVLLTGAAFSIDSDTASNVTVTGNNLTLSTVTSGNVVVSSAADVDMDGANLLLDATSGISLDAAAASNFTVAGANLTLSTTTSGNVIANAAGDVDVDGANVLVDATSGISLDAAAASNFTVAGADLTMATTTSGDIFLRVPAGAGNVTIDEGAGTNYLRTNTTTRELELGDATGTAVDVRVLRNLVVENDLTVNGTTTTVNTENLLVEDRLIRLNKGAAAAFSGTTGFEAEVGSDGYVEFHWDDAQTRWEVSIDRNTTPEAQTFRPVPYLADTPATLDLSAAGGATAPNTTSGAADIGTASSNYTSFGSSMTGEHVQAALEAIDGYLTNNAVTLQQAYLNDVDGANATITTDANDGNVVIAGTQALQVTATNGLDLDSGFDMDATSAFDVLLTGAAFSIDSDTASNVTVTGNNLTLSTVTSGNVVIASAADVDMDGANLLLDATAGISLDAAAASNFTTSAGALTLDGAGGVVLDGNGSNVVPAADNTDTLGSGAAGWVNVFTRNVANTATVGIKDAGGAGTPNTTSGAAAVGTNSSNYLTFGPSMAENSVQGALEALDGYLQAFSGNTTLQQAYKNDVDGGDAVITTDATDGNVVIAGTQAFQVTATNGIDLDSGFDMDATSAFDVLLTGAAFSIDSDTASNVTVTGNNLTLSTVTSGNVVIASAADVDMDGANLLLDATSGISLDSAAASNFTVAGANLTLSTTTSGNVIANAAGDVDVDGVNVLIDATTAISLDAAAASNFTTSAGALTLDGAGGVVLDGNGSNVVPAADNTDTLGSGAAGWVNVFTRNVAGTATVGIKDAGGAGAPNTTSGAAAIGTNSSNFTTFGGSMGENSTQSALEAIDGYFTTILDSSFAQTRTLDINGAVLNGNVNLAFVGSAPALVFQQGKTDRASWSIEIPGDWDRTSNITVDVLWSPSNTNTGNVEWRLEYLPRSLTELMSAATTNDDFLQAGGGTTDGLQTTGGNLTILSSNVTINDSMIVVNIVRRGTVGTDTFTGDAQVHAIKLSYSSQNVI